MAIGWSQPAKYTRPPLVTVLVGCYNHARFVEECLEGVRHQTYRQWELIIFDDCSADSSVEVITRWLSRTGIRAEFIRHTQNVGVCKSMNEALRLARGEYISIVAADDAWLPDKLEVQVTAMEGLPKTVGVIYSDAYQMDEHGQILPKMFIEAHQRHLEAFPQGQIHETLWQGNFIPAMTTLVRRACYDEVGVYDESLAVEDWDMWLRISERFEFRFSPKVSARYRLVRSSIVRSRPDLLYHSRAEVARKFLETGKLRGISKAKAIEYLSSYAEALYRQGDPRTTTYMRTALRYRKSFRLALTYFLTVARIPAPIARKIYHILRRPGG